MTWAPIYWASGDYEIRLIMTGRSAGKYQCTKGSELPFRLLSEYLGITETFEEAQALCERVSCLPASSSDLGTGLVAEISCSPSES